jgi:hypothetical protein
MIQIGPDIGTESTTRTKIVGLERFKISRIEVAEKFSLVSGLMCNRRAYFFLQALFYRTCSNLVNQRAEL